MSSTVRTWVFSKCILIETNQNSLAKNIPSDLVLMTLVLGLFAILKTDSRGYLCYLTHSQTPRLPDCKTFALQAKYLNNREEMNQALTNFTDAHNSCLASCLSCFLLVGWLVTVGLLDWLMA